MGSFLKVSLTDDKSTEPNSDTGCVCVCVCVDLGTLLLRAVLSKLQNSNFLIPQ